MSSNERRTRALLARGEGLDVEFKTYRGRLNRDVYETVCAFLNRHGGTLLQETRHRRLFSRDRPCRRTGLRHARYGKSYGGATPELIEGDTFRIVIPVPEYGEKPQGTTARGSTEQVTEQVKRLLAILEKGELGSRQLMEKLGLNHRPGFLYDYVQPALSIEVIEMTQPNSPNSPTQKYRLTPKGRNLLKDNRQ